ncbi:head maturation protease, ClpP-related [Bacillus swezeyi]|uniref:ATP-dependent Clp protease proteolytic subunit n=1 Tax=Bacillus swezeyi TaxID=1925020 RepID=A0A5M8RKE3_9BACI|nr:head maturation protease, ClpP-related [Bacillus swezeyi]KAA6447583.1 Clp protease ClpP [Bacillus swezeyi]TYS34164.1 Clp protease ClpP [Bacillus swezeyi]
MTTDNLQQILQVKNMNETSADLYFYGDIVSSWWGAWDDTDQYPEAVKNFLDEAKGKELNIYINSGGGSVFAGIAIYNMIKRHQGYKRVYVDGLAASIASIIALAGDETYIPANAYYMIHKPWFSVSGNADDLRTHADVLDTVESGVMTIYMENAKEGVTDEQIKQMLKDETWLTGEEASQYFNVKVSDEVKAVACASDMYKEFKHTPKALTVPHSADRSKDYMFAF